MSGQDLKELGLKTIANACFDVKHDETNLVQEFGQKANLELNNKINNELENDATPPEPSNGPDAGM